MEWPEDIVPLVYVDTLVMVRDLIKSQERQILDHVF